MPLRQHVRRGVERHIHIAIDLGATSVRVVFIDHTGKVVWRSRKIDSLTFRGPTATVRQIKMLIDEGLAALTATVKDVKSCVLGSRIR